MANSGAANRESELLEAAEIGNVAKVKEILTQGKININAQGAGGMTALHHAAQNAHLKVVQELLKHGADVHQKNAHNLTAAQMAYMNGELIETQKEIVDAIQRYAIKDKRSKQLHFLGNSTLKDPAIKEGLKSFRKSNENPDEPSSANKKGFGK